MRSMLCAAIAAFVVSHTPSSAQLVPVDSQGVPLHNPTEWIVEDYGALHKAGTPYTVGDLYAAWDNLEGDPNITLLIGEAGAEPAEPNPRVDLDLLVVQNNEPAQGDKVIDNSEISVVVAEQINPADTYWECTKEHILKVLLTHGLAAVFGYAAAKALTKKQIG